MWIVKGTNYKSEDTFCTNTKKQMKSNAKAEHESKPKLIKKSNHRK